MWETIITALATCIAGNLAMFFFFPQERKAKNLENEAKQSEEWKKLYEETHEELQSRDTKIDELYAEISRHRDEKAKQAIRITELEVENTKLKLLKCEVPSCPNRQPPTGY
jgi:hypothetical protein